MSWTDRPAGTPAEREHAPGELLDLSDADLLSSLGLVRSGQITRGGIILAGRERSIAEHLPGYGWTHIRMSGDTDYSDRMDGTGRSTYCVLRPDLHRRLMAPDHPERDRRIDREAAKTRVLSVLRQRSIHGEGGLSNAEVRQITHLDRHQVLRLMKELQREEPAVVREGVGKGSRYCYLAEGDPRRVLRSDM